MAAVRADGVGSGVGVGDGNGVAVGIGTAVGVGVVVGVGAVAPHAAANATAIEAVANPSNVPICCERIMLEW